MLRFSLSQVCFQSFVLALEFEVWVKFELKDPNYCWALLETKLFISINNYLQILMIKEFNEVQNSLKFIQGIESLPMHMIKVGFFPTSICCKQH